jgi:hypothetical protein
MSQVTCFWWRIRTVVRDAITLKITKSFVPFHNALHAAPLNYTQTLLKPSITFYQLSERQCCYEEWLQALRRTSHGQSSFFRTRSISYSHSYIGEEREKEDKRRRGFLTGDDSVLCCTLCASYLLRGHNHRNKVVFVVNKQVYYQMVPASMSVATTMPYMHN